MKTVLVVGAVSLLASLLSGCDNPSAPAGGGGADKAATIVGVWNCVTKGGARGADLADSQTFSADGWFSSSKFPEGKKYKYRVTGSELVVSMPQGDWPEKIAQLSGNSLEYYNGRSDDADKVICQKQ